MSKDDGGPAYPVLNPVTQEQYSGMTLRDYFAAQALAGYCSLDDGTGFAGLSKFAYDQADAMLTERSKRDKP